LRIKLGIVNAVMKFMLGHGISELLTVIWHDWYDVRSKWWHDWWKISCIERSRRATSL